MSARRQLVSCALALGAAVLVVGCHNDDMHNDNNMRNNNRSDSMNTGTGSMQRSSNDANRNMGVQTSERVNDTSRDMNNGMNSGATASGGMSADNMRNDSNTTGNMASSMQMSDQQFVQMVASSDMFEIQSSQLAAERTKDPMLKKFAEQMIAAHNKTTSQLKDLVKTNNWTMPTSMTPEHQQQLTTLRNAQGDAFDAAYRASQVRAHQMAVTMFQNQAQNGQDANLKAWAGKTVPALQMHLDMINKMGSGSSHDMNTHR